ncbi:insulinase family protein [Leuconostoc pseudomesenteroides]|jgi:predicted Zn-dependent peptidase|uniref:Insulinase family protein n=1 Tax=Leuconostoc falkenbergense TaxID=2766470 RepID=A0A9X3ECL3_9LACO|nr:MULTISPECIES: pitrilysin family protein [Leuconostoc]RDG20146.1 insulinase family protein [Leuconostoc pseudomesenteroides]MCT4388962.1 insulinase family protein [Leuconostoc falkenbergense]MCT4411113.1 insulinase family protein [Leuconostoc falkenbergense]MCX7578658.1 insulinase family protein [Leuconostoc falkenbergense]MDM7645500.1 pitrilysin family protein [Leuconostoc falkenbergense]
MLEKYYKQLKEKVLTETMPDGLKVVMVEKPDYHKTFAVLTTDYGSLDEKYQVGQGSPKKIPAGTAHFLEHKLFEKENEDAFTRFGQLGADANAFTNAYQTSYLFSTTQHVVPALRHLLQFVQTPYFSDKTVAKEQGIIGQEIQMYEDDPNWAVYMGILSMMYPESPMAHDIAGTQQSIATITPELLYDIHHAFYQPSQLTLQVIGHFDKLEVLETISQTQQLFSGNSSSVTRLTPNLQPAVNLSDTRQFNISRPKVAFGIRINGKPLRGTIVTKRTLAVDLMLDLLFGEQTDWYQKLYNKGIIDSEFDTSFDLIREYQFISIFAETTAYQALEKAIQTQINQYRSALKNQAHNFEQLKRATIGEGIQRLNSLENIALRGDDALSGANLFDKIELLQDLTFDDILVTADIIFQGAVLQRFVLQK